MIRDLAPLFTILRGPAMLCLWLVWSLALIAVSRWIIAAIETRDLRTIAAAVVIYLLLTGTPFVIGGR